MFLFQIQTLPNVTGLPSTYVNSSFYDGLEY